MEPLEGFICWQQGCEKGCDGDQDCNTNGKCIDDDDCAEDESCSNGYCLMVQELWDRVCNPDGYCISAPQKVCKNDTECPAKEVPERDTNGDPLKDEFGAPITRFIPQYCFDGKCGDGCRVNRDCEPGQTCAENQCKWPCSTNKECREKGWGNNCAGDPNARSGANKKWQMCLSQLKSLEDDPYTPNWQISEKREECKDLEDLAKNAAPHEHIVKTNDLTTLRSQINQDRPKCVYIWWLGLL